MILKTTFALALMTTLAGPALAQDTMNRSTTTSSAGTMGTGTMGTGTMATGNDMMAGDQAMKPMSKADTAMMTKCHKMSAAMMKKNARCTKLMAMHKTSKM